MGIFAPALTHLERTSDFRGTAVLQQSRYLLLSTPECSKDTFKIKTELDRQNNRLGFR